MTLSLAHLLSSDAKGLRPDFYLIPDGFLTPGYWVAYSAKALNEGLEDKNITFPSRKLSGYASAIGLSRLLWGQDNYQAHRVNEGKNYSTLTLLDAAEATDRATEHINSCVRLLITNEEYQEFVAGLCDVIGDLHDNVWSHGQSSGVSMAQKWRCGHNDHFIEFALADCGLGFRRELSRVGLVFKSDQEAIEWCIQEGNSTKKRAVQDAFSQRLPGDIIGNPIPGVGVSVANDNHHMGLGLAKLVDLVQRYHGELWLASGTDMLIIESDGSKHYEKIKFPWNGVAIACRFCTKRMQPNAVDEDPNIERIMQLLRS
jgi:hypothetical protein